MKLNTFDEHKSLSELINYTIITQLEQMPAEPVEYTQRICKLNPYDAFMYLQSVGSWSDIVKNARSSGLVQILHQDKTKTKQFNDIKKILQA